MTFEELMKNHSVSSSQKCSEIIKWVWFNLFWANCLLWL